MTQELQGLLTVAQAAKLLGVSRQRVADLCKTGRLAARLLGNRYVIDQQSAEAYRDSPLRLAYRYCWRGQKPKRIRKGE